MAARSRWSVTLLLLIALAGCGPAKEVAEKPADKPVENPPAAVVNPAPPEVPAPPAVPKPKPAAKPKDGDTYEVVYTDVKPPPPADDGLTDDLLADKKPVFAADLIDRRQDAGWLINQSAAVLRLNSPMVMDEPELRTLYPSYQAALQQAGRNWRGHSGRGGTLVSVNMLDGVAKQFDDGLYAAIDLAWFRGRKDQLQSHVELVQKLLAKVGPASPAAPYLAAGLTLGGAATDVPDRAARDNWVRDFESNPAASKPIGFYTWNDDLKKCWRFMRFFQQSLPENSPESKGLVAALAADTTLKAEYEKHATFFGKLTNPLARLTLADLIGVDVAAEPALVKLRSERGIRMPGVAFFPPNASRETELFRKLFPRGLPEGANLMKELIAAIRSGAVDLAPRDSSGWYDHQVFALETLLLPGHGEESNKLLLSKAYKKRMLEAFAALITKRRETHVRSLDNTPKSADPGEKGAFPPPPPPKNFAPRLRLEPCPTFYVRTARSYAFLEAFLTSSLGEATMKSLHGLRANGERKADLAAELAAHRDLFYGLYLVSCDDIGLAPKLAENEVKDVEACYARATQWLNGTSGESDLAPDTRVAVPIHFDLEQRKTRLWVTLGVRLAPLDVSYAKAPSVKPAEGEMEWMQVERSRLESRSYLIAVDEYAEVEVPTLAPPTREELRAICDKQVTKEKILATLREGKW